MNLTRIIRTTRHLTAEQWIYRFVCRGKFAAMEKLPDLAARWFRHGAEAVPLPDPSTASLAAISGHVRQLQRAVHGQWSKDVPTGRFTLLNQTIDFGGLEKVEWRRELGEKNNRLWRMNLSYMGYLVPLFEDDARAALPTALSLLKSMNEQNPWSSSGISRDVWHPYSVSHRVINLLACLQMLYQAAPELIGLAKPLTDEVRLGAGFLLGNLERDLQYNHLLKNYVTLATVAAAAPGKHFARSVLSGTAASIRQQFMPDGGQAERAPMYHILSLLDLRILRDSGALDADTQSLVEQTASAAEHATSAMVHPDGQVALFNDSWLGEGPPAAEAVPGITLAPDLPSRWVLPNAGYVRLAQATDSVVMDFGACGPDDNPGHAHADFLSIELSVAGERLIVDTGVPTYSEGHLRDASRSGLAHNGPRREGLEPIEFWGSFRVGHRGYAYSLPSSDQMTFAAWQDGYISHDTAVARAIRLVPGHGLLICDLWAGAPAGTAESRFTVPGRWQINGTTARLGSTAAHFHAIDGMLSDFKPAQHWLRFGEALDAHVIALTPSPQQARLAAASLWISWKGDSSPPPSAVHELRGELEAAFVSIAQVSRIVG